MKPRRRIVALGLLLLMLAAAGCASVKTDVQTEFDIRADNEYMQVAIDEALDGISRQHGGPFGCVIVKDGRIVGQGHNRVPKHCSRVLPLLPRNRQSALDKPRYYTYPYRLGNLRRWLLP